MRKLLALVTIVVAFALPAFATDDITVDRPTNLFNTEVSAASSTMRAVRVGRINTVPSVVFNQPNYTPVILDAVDGVLRYNGTSLTTATFTGTDMAISNDLTVGNNATVTATVQGADLVSTDDVTVGDDLGVTGKATVSETLQVDGATTLGAAVYVGSAGTKSTMTATGNITAGAALAATTSVSAGTSVSATTTVTGGTGVIATAGPMTLYSRTMAQLLGMTPTAVGQMYYCSDCTRKVVVSTGTTLWGQFAGAEGGKFE